MSEAWRETIGNRFEELDIKEITRNALKSLEEQRKEIEEEEKKYKDKWNSLSKEKKEELILEVEKIAINRPFGKLVMTKKIILLELMGE